MLHLDVLSAMILFILSVRLSFLRKIIIVFIIIVGIFVCVCLLEIHLHLNVYPPVWVHTCMCGDKQLGQIKPNFALASRTKSVQMCFCMACPHKTLRVENLQCGIKHKRFSIYGTHRVENFNKLFWDFLNICFRIP